MDFLDQNTQDGAVDMLEWTNTILYGIIVITIIAAVALYIELLIKHIKCARKGLVGESCEV